MNRFDRDGFLYDVLPLLIAVIGIRLIWGNDTMLRHLVDVAAVGYAFFWGSRFVVLIAETLTPRRSKSH
jgi:hypothetical protein